MNKSWSNTSLVAYPLLPKIAREIDKSVKTRICSSFQSKHLQFGVSTQQLVDEIIQLNDEKRKIINLRFIVNNALEKMTDKNRDILIARIISKKTFQQIADEQDTSLRTVFRRVASAEEDYAHCLTISGYTEDWFEREYGTDKYINPIHQRILQDKYFVAKNL